MVLRAAKEMGPTAEQSTDLRDHFDGRPMCIAGLVGELWLLEVGEINKMDCNHGIVGEGGLQKKRGWYRMIDMMNRNLSVPHSCLWLYWLLRYGYCKYVY